MKGSTPSAFASKAEPTSSYIVAFDQGTTSSRTIIFDHAGSIISLAQQEIERTFPQSGWVQQDAIEIWSSQLSTFTQALSQADIHPDQIAAIGIANQRETTIIWDRATGKPVYDAIVWQCRRGDARIAELEREGYAPLITAKTGLIPDAYFSASKIAWILDNIEGTRARAEAGELAFGTVDSWLLWNLTDGQVHATDVTNASRTMLFNINTLEFDDELLGLFNIPRSLLPEVKPSSGLFGHIDSPLIGAPIPISGIAGDQQAALFGQCCFAPGEAKNTYGTGCFMLMNTGTKPMLSNCGLLTTIAYADAHKTTYAIEGSVFNAGSAVKWLRDSLKTIETVEESAQVAASIDSTNGCYFVPAFNGLGAPHWDDSARGAIIGMTQSTTRSHIVRATLESIAYQSADVLTAMEHDSSVSLCELRVDGGVSANDFVMQFQADILARNVVRPVMTEMTALGAAYMAGLTVGYWGSEDELRTLASPDKVFSPQASSEHVAKLLGGWQKAIACVAKGPAN